MNSKRINFQPKFVDDCRLMDFADGILQTEDGQSFNIHRIVLAKQSKYFCALFCNKPKDENTFLIPGLKGDVLCNILSYIYTRKIYITDENICEIMMTSEYLMLDDLLSEIKEFLKKNLSVDNCLHIFTTALMINREDFTRECYRFAQTHFETITRNDSTAFRELPPEIFKVFLGDRNLCVTSEKMVFLAIIKWVSSNISNRLPLVPELMMNLVMSDVDEDLATEILKHDIIANNPYCTDLIDKRKSFDSASNFQFLRSYMEEQPKSFIPIYDKRLPCKLNCIIRYCVINAVDGIEVYITYDENIDLWRQIVAIGMNTRATICINDSIYMFKTDDNRNFRYQISDRQWYELDDFMIPRRNYAVLNLEETIYVLGGICLFTEVEIYNVEIYDTRYDVWYFTESMFAVTCFAAATLNKSIYVIGYKMNHEVYEMIAQVYEASSETWYILPAVSIARTDFAVIAYQEKIYVIGGMNSNGYLKDVEVFDPFIDEWKVAESLPHIFYNPAAIVLNDSLIVYDSHMQDRVYLETNAPVYWNSDKACWETFEESSAFNNLHLYQFLSLENMESISMISSENRHANFEKSPFS